MSLLGDIITVAQLADAELPELKELGDAVLAAINQKNAAAATQAAILGADEGIDAEVDAIFASKKGLL